MFKKLWNKINNWFTPEEQMDPHEELYTKVPEPETPVHIEEPKSNHCTVHTRFRRHCPACAGVV